MSLSPAHSTFLSRLAAFADSRKPKTTELIGTIERVKMFGADWGVATMWTEDRKEVKLTGPVGDLQEGVEYSVATVLKHHPKHGESHEVLGARPHVQLNNAAMVKFIAKNFKGIGTVLAQKFLTAVEFQSGQEGLVALREKLLNEPWAVDFSTIKREGKYDSDEKDMTLHAFIQRDLAIRIVGLRANVLKRLADYLTVAVHTQNRVADAAAANDDPVASAWATLARDPYAPIATVAGYGFTSADMVGRMVNVPREAPVRLAALAAHAIVERCEAYGHVYLTFEQALEGIAKVDAQVSAQKAISHALASGTVCLDDHGGKARIYPTGLLQREVRLATKLAEMCAPTAPLVKGPTAGLGAKIQSAAKQLGGAFKDGMDDSQVAALAGIVTARTRLHTITAEPGSGKTAVMEVLSRVLPNKSFLFCAPTGKGSKVLSNRVKSIGATASTIHSMLRGDVDGGFAFNATNPLETDILVIDEGSMPDLALTAAVFDAVSDTTHVIVLGDVDQLPSIAPGRVLADLLEIAQADHHRLTSVHRNSGGILEVIREVKSGSLDPRDRIGVQFSGTLPPAASGFHGLVREYLQAVGRSGYEGTALLMSRRKGEVDEPGWNTTYANAVLRDICNPNAQKVPGSTLCVGDRIMIKANMLVNRTGEEADAGHEERVVNGDTGSIQSFALKGGSGRDARLVDQVQLRLDDGRSVDFPGGELHLLQLGYALTVHAAQGSEYKDVIAVITPGMPTFINRNMLYTGLSRARVNLSVHGNDVELRKVAATPMPARNSGLVRRVRNCLAESDGGDDDARRHTVGAER